MAKDWMDAVSEDEHLNAVDKVSRNQRKFDIYSGTRMSNCERCRFVERDSSYPGGSPTGLLCNKKSVFVTANATCDEYKKG